MTNRQASQWLYRNWDRIIRAFQEQCPRPTGGLCNARLAGVEHGQILLRCHYDNYTSAEDSWHWYLDPQTMRFHG